MHKRMSPGRMEFHVSRTARDRYQFDESLFSSTGNVIFANFHAARVFAQKMNDKRDLINFPEQAVRAGQINAMGLIDEMLHVMVDLYRKQVNPNIFQDALSWLSQSVGPQAVERALHRFADQFPPLAVYRRELDIETYLRGETDGISNREILLEEMLMLWLENSNPAFAPFLELFDDDPLEKQTAYPTLIDQLHEFFDEQPGLAGQGQSLLRALRAPALAAPHSLTAQLEFLLQRWGGLLGPLVYRILGSLDLIKEEEKLIFIGPGGAIGPGPAVVYDFTGLEIEAERFSPDREWMPQLVMIAKNAYVWLDQLAKKYERPITRLDEVPDEELDQLGRWGLSGLWLIGLWERSPASKRIKQIMGNQDAVASAYSLMDYRIADDLGGDAAIANLRQRAWRRGIRLASDMVPNHMGIDSNWVMQHPDWFVGQPYSPFPSYSFNGPDLSWDPQVGIYLEDHYYSRTDAAVVFKRVDRRTGEERYIYHGNDGTSMPWNDTAQLNYLMPEVREAVIQTILHVARQFPIIRFDAAMTLAKKHYQRLWFPQPGSGGDIPSRAEHELTKEQFDAAMPQEFWREVVDRCAQEAPDTLLLAEAFWLMEGYFVRTLGMHRVYNSAFMNMLRDEKNAEYRQVIKNTLEFDPEILKRYVNFMNNPDERTAVDQFGKGDKYFGVCTVMVTMPGLPMLGHGQVEGFAEKYGMEYRRAYWDEQADPWLVQRHEREIFPLMHRRHLFAHVENFLLYDLYTPEGAVNEDVLAYSNRHGDEGALVLYNNKYASTKGWLRSSASYSVKAGNNGERRLEQRNLGEGLGLHNDERYFAIFREHLSGLEFIRNSKELHEKGLYVELGAYQYQVFLDFREAMDNEWHQYSHLADYLNGRGVHSIDDALREIFLEPVRGPFRELVNADLFQRLIAARSGAAAEESVAVAEEAVPVDKSADRDEQLQLILDEVEQKSINLLRGIKHFTDGTGDEQQIAQQIRRELEAILGLPEFTRSLVEDETGAEDELGLAYLNKQLNGDPFIWGTLINYTFTHALGMISAEAGAEQHSRSWLDEWLLGKIIAGALQDLGLDEAAAWRAVNLLKLLVSHQNWFEHHAVGTNPACQVVTAWLQDSDVHLFLAINRHLGVLWFNHEAFEQLLWWMFAQELVTLAAAEKQPAAELLAAIRKRYEIIAQLQEAQAESDYQVEKLLEAVAA